MDCNKDEAERAAKAAEEKMNAGDFVGAYVLATKAQRLYPNLENIAQMLAICDVQCSANEKIDGLDNWYGILGVQDLDDFDTIKKQYRKLTVLLHPDKNKFAGAEAAFKLVGEANRWLSDPEQRCMYDIRYISHSLLARKQSKKHPGRYYAAANIYAEDLASAGMFWTFCTNCLYEYIHPREYMRTVMHCVNCQKSYLALKMWYSEADIDEYNKMRETQQDSYAEVEEIQKSADKSIPPNLSDSKKDQAAQKRRCEVDGSKTEDSYADVGIAELRRRLEELEKFVEEADRKLRADKSIPPDLSDSKKDHAAKKRSCEVHDGSKTEGSYAEVHRKRRVEEIQNFAEETANKLPVADKQQRMHDLNKKKMKTPAAPQSDTEVKELAIQLKGKIRSGSSSLQVLDFLHFIVAHNRLQNSIINQDEVTKLASSVAHYKEAPTLFQSLGLDHVIPEFVEELINTRQYIPAVRLICFFKLKGFSPKLLLKREIIALSSTLETELQAGDKEGGKLRDILHLVADYKLNIDIPGELIVKLMIQRPDNQNQVLPSTSNLAAWVDL